MTIDTFDLNYIDSVILEHSKEIHDNSNVLICVDLDMTIFNYKEDFLSLNAINKYKKTLGELFKNLNQKEKNLALTIAIQDKKPILTDKNWPIKIKNWKDKGYRVIAFSAFCNIDGFKEKRVEYLQNLKIDFDKSFECKNFYEGILGTVRKNYLSKMIEAANCTKEI